MENTMNMTAPAAPEWIYDASFYHIYPLGLTGAPKWNEGSKTAGSRILTVSEWIPHMKELGINAIYFGPIFESLSHGYDTSDYYHTDSRLGSAEDFKKVFNDLHENGIRIILDGVFNHTGRGFWAFNDVQNKLQNSDYVSWFQGIDFSRRSPAGDPFSYEMWEGNADLVKLNLKNPDVCAHLLGAVKMWIDEFHIDGLRLDAADCVDMDFFRQLHSFTKSIDPDFWLMGEIIHGDYTRWANSLTLDSTTNYECWKGIYSSLNDKNFFEIAYSLKRQFGEQGIYKDLMLYNFLDNHDVNRIASLLKDTRNLKNAWTLMYFMPGVPSVYYGSEFSLPGVKGHGADADLPVRPCLDIHQLENIGDDNNLSGYIGMLGSMRRNNEALRRGQLDEILVTNRQFVFARSLNGHYAGAAFNVSDDTETLDFEYSGRHFHLTLAPCSSQIFTD